MVSDDEAMRAAIDQRDITWDGIVVVCPPRVADESLPIQEQLDLARTRTLRIADIVRTVSRMGARNSPRLWIVTRGAQQLDPTESVTLAQTQLRGIARVLTFEHPELKTTLVDVDPDGTHPPAGLVDELLACSDQDEVALRAGQRYVSRLAPTPMVSGELTPETRFSTVDLDAGGAFTLDGDLRVSAAGRSEPAGNQVEVRVLVAPLSDGDDITECLGVVTRGPETGRRVIAFGAAPPGPTSPPTPTSSSRCPTP